MEESKHCMCEYKEHYTNDIAEPKKILCNHHPIKPYDENPSISKLETINRPAYVLSQSKNSK